MNNYSDLKGEEIEIASIWRRGILGRKKSGCKGPNASANLTHLINVEDSMAGMKLVTRPL